MTIGNVVRPVAMEYSINYMLGRGFCSSEPRHGIAERYKASWKEKLLILLLSDFDPDGEQIGQRFVSSIRDEFGIVFYGKLRFTKLKFRKGP